MFEFKPSAKPGVCDRCGGATVQRKDDAPETVIERLRTYHEQTAPLAAFYDERGKLVKVEGQDEVKETSALVLKAVNA